jgi:hypothetical protein
MDFYSRKKARGTADVTQVPRCDAPNLSFRNTELNHAKSMKRMSSRICQNLENKEKFRKLRKIHKNSRFKASLRAAIFNESLVTNLLVKKTGN